jgi:branched-chain amino acid transport system substrate-binding protein
MSDDRQENLDSRAPVIGGKSVSRREFLRMAGLAGAAIGVGGGLTAFAAACGGGTTTTSAGPTTTAGATTTAAGPTTTAVVATTASTAAPTSTTAAAEVGAPLKLGVVYPQTGPIAAFGIPDKYCLDRFKEYVGDGIVCGDQKKHPVQVDDRDSQSDSNRAGQVAAELIGNGINLMAVASTADTVNPVADQCEGNAVPCVSADCPWQAYVFGRKGSFEAPFKWTYHFFWGLEDIGSNYEHMWQQIATNKVHGTMYSNDADGNAFGDPKTGMPASIQHGGMKWVSTTPFNNGTEDFTSYISTFKKEGCQIISGLFLPPDFANFWKQARQQGLKPMIMTGDKAMLFPQAAEAVGDIALNVTSGCWWHPSWPFKSSLTGETCQAFADDYEKRTNSQWTQPLLHLAIYEMANYAFKNAKDPANKDSLLEAIKSMKLDTIGGSIDFTAAVTAQPTPGLNHVHPNVYKSAIMAGQWVKGTKYKFDYLSVDNTNYPSISATGKLAAIASA